MNPQKPLVSVLLPVYDGAAFLKEAIESILLQTCHDFEFIIINDGSRDNSSEIIRGFRDPRIRLFDQENQGLAATLNRAITLSRGSYLARQDQDDISLPQRLERQIAFLEGHVNFGMVGTWAEIWVGANRTERRHEHPAENPILKFDLLFDNPFVHSSVMFRRSVFERVGTYSTDKSRQPPEDYELWSRLARHFDVGNIPECLVIYREVNKSMSRDGVNPFLDRVIDISIENLVWATGKSEANRDIADLAALLHAAHHRVSLRPSLMGMSKILIDAADGVSRHCNMPPNRLKERALSRLNDLKHHYSHSGKAPILRRAWIRLLDTTRSIGS